MLLSSSSYCFFNISSCEPDSSIKQIIYGLTYLLGNFFIFNFSVKFRLISNFNKRFILFSTVVVLSICATLECDWWGVKDSRSFFVVVAEKMPEATNLSISPKKTIVDVTNFLILQRITATLLYDTPIEFLYLQNNKFLL